MRNPNETTPGINREQMDHMWDQMEVRLAAFEALRVLDGAVFQAEAPLVELPLIESICQAEIVR